MNITLVDKNPKRFYPLTQTRPISYLRVGAFTIQEKWLKLFPESTVNVKCETHLQAKFQNQNTEDSFFIDSCIVPTLELAEELKQASVSSNVFSAQDFSCEVKQLIELTDLFVRNDEWIRNDESIFSSEFTKSTTTPNGVIVTGDSLYLGKNVTLNPCFINTSTGPVIIDDDAEVMEGAMLRGPLYVGKHSTIKMGCKVYGATTIGPHVKVGGEISNSVFQGYANKGHDGFLGNSIIGEWCNLGADTNSSNLKNNYSTVNRWDYEEKKLNKTALQFCGLLMGDHSKSAINTMFNTATTVGVCSNIFASNFPPKYVPSFSWLGDGGLEDYNFDKALETARAVMGRRTIELTEEDKQILSFISNEKE